VEGVVAVFWIAVVAWAFVLFLFVCFMALYLVVGIIVGLYRVARYLIMRHL
jgi:hypothetical protein